MKIINSRGLHNIDNATCESQHISSIDLMERAASAVSIEIISRFLPSKRIIVFAGPGNNGGDALAVARMLMEQGYKRVEVFLFNVTGKLSHDCEEEYKRLITIDGVDFTEVTHAFNPPYIGKNDIVIDGLFGSGLNAPLQGGFIAVARYINESGAYVISIDIPSGLFCEWNADINTRDVVHANLTLSFQLPRLAFFFAENYNILGEWKLLDIDLDEEKIKETTTDYFVIDSRNIVPLLRNRLPFTGKRDYGSALIFAGSTGMMGAAVMCSQAVMKCGAGLATVHSARNGLTIVQTAAPEIMYEPDRNEHYITDMTVHHNHQAIAVGPGIGTQEPTINALQALLQHTTIPIVLDADALNCISRRPALLALLPPKTIITPHIGEFDRLFGEHDSSEKRLRTAIEMSRQYNIIIVLKGHYSAVVRPTGRVYFNSTGNAGMATAGAGDVLTGVITAFLAQGYDPEYAATLGVYIHGLAGDLAAEDLGEFGLTAPDIANYIGRAIRETLSKRK
ncbi:MAG: NAD(P)H-hydrate dehydratase [Candidatus Amulumruptor caecigallinarius]|nr:NAD(P)H-hydrate dehydratase [Candidatus Amulumruptor caecigallinarius]